MVLRMDFRSTSKCDKPCSYRCIKNKLESITVTLLNFSQHFTLHLFQCGLHVVAGWLTKSTTIRVVTSWLIFRFSCARFDVPTLGAPLTKRRGNAANVAQHTTRDAHVHRIKEKVRILLTFDSNVRPAVFFSCVLAFTSIFCFSYVSL